MTGDALLVDEIDIRQAPGFETGGFPVEDLCSGINIVYGPNASGKTTIARSTQWLLWPGEAEDRASLIGQLSLNGENWRVEVAPGKTTYQRNGQETNGPGLPPADQRDRYHLALHDLLQYETRNETFTKAIKRESAGGYDLSAAHDSLGFSDSPSTRGKGVVKDAKSAVEAWRSAQDEIEELRGEQDRLPVLRTELEEAREAQDRVDLLEQAIKYAQARKEVAEARDVFETFPEVLTQIDGDEADTVDQLEEDIERWEARKEDAEEQLERAERKQEEANLPDEDIPSGRIGSLKARRDKLSKREDKKNNLEGSVADARERRRKALEEIPLEIEEHLLTDFDTTNWEKMAEFSRQAERVRAGRETKDAVEGWLGNRERPDEERSDLERGSQALENWLLTIPKELSDGGDKTFKIAAVSATLLAVTGLTLTVLISPIFVVFVVAAISIGWYGYRIRSDVPENGQSRQPYRDSFENLQLTPPESWTREEVRERLFETYDALKEHSLDKNREERLEALKSNVDDLEREEQALTQWRTQLQEDLGVASDVSNVELTVTVKGILSWQDANRDVRGHQKEIDTVEEQIEDFCGRIQDELEPYGYTSVDDAADATGYIRDLESRATKHNEAKREIKQAEGTIDDAVEELESLRFKREDVFTKISLDFGEKNRLQTLCDQAEDFQEAEKDLENAKLLAKREENDLEGSPGYEPDVKDRDVASLRQDKREAEELAANYDEIQASITEIETKVNGAKRDSQVEKTLAERERALDALYEQLNDDYTSMVGHVLTEHVQKETSETSRPEVFRHARTILTRITKGRYRLDLDEQEDTFRAYDTIQEKGFGLDELSSATRLQVLMAVRIAFVEQHEQGIQLPLILDETFANTDDSKAEVIIEAMIELARDGRQVFYFTAQGSEVAKWLTMLDSAADVDHSVVDLANLRDLNGHVRVPEPAEISVRGSTPPSPQSHDHDSYGEAIDVPPFNPRKAGDTHLWYIVDDVDLLHYLLDMDIEHWGQLDNILYRSDGSLIADDPQTIRRLKQNGQAVEEFVRSWKKGRGESVDRQVLEESDAVSTSFIDETTRLSEAVNGEADQIIEELRNGEVSRFRTDKMDKLEQYFEENGYIKSLNPLEPDQVRIRVIENLLKNGVPRKHARKRADTILARIAL